MSCPRITEVVVCALVDAGRDLRNVSTGEFALSGQLVQELEFLDLPTDGLTGYFAPVDLRVTLHSLFEGLVNVDSDGWHT